VPQSGLQENTAVDVTALDSRIYLYYLKENQNIF